MLNIWWKSILEYSLPGKSTCTLNRHCGCWFWGPKFFLCSFPENSLHLSWLQSFFCTCLGLKGCVKYRKSCFTSTILCVSPEESLSLSQTENTGCLCHLLMTEQTALPRAPVWPDCLQQQWISKPHGFVPAHNSGGSPQNTVASFSQLWARDFHEFCDSKSGVIWLRKSCQCWFSPFLGIYFWTPFLASLFALPFSFLRSCMADTKQSLI